MNKRTFTIIIFTASVALIIITAVLAYNFLNPLSNIEKTTSIEFPRGISNIDTVDNFEYLIMAHAKLPLETISDFIEDHNFSDELPDEYAGFSYTASNVKLQNLYFQIQFLEPENREFPLNANLYFLNGKDRSHCWIYVLDENSGRVWIAVFYPDRSGDLYCR